jgi:hypothetical protein
MGKRVARVGGVRRANRIRYVGGGDLIRAVHGMPRRAPAPPAPPPPPAEPEEVTDPGWAPAEPKRRPARRDDFGTLHEEVTAPGLVRLESREFALPAGAALRVQRCR